MMFSDKNETEIKKVIQRAWLIVNDREDWLVPLLNYLIKEDLLTASRVYAAHQNLADDYKAVRFLLKLAALAPSILVVQLLQELARRKDVSERVGDEWWRGFALD